MLTIGRYTNKTRSKRHSATPCLGLGNSSTKITGGLVEYMRLTQRRFRPFFISSSALCLLSYKVLCAVQASFRIFLAFWESLAQYFSLFTMAINTDPSTHQQAIVIVCIVSPVVACLFVGIRIWTRAFVLHSVGWDDCKLVTPSVSLRACSHTYRSCPDNFGNYVLVVPALTLRSPYSLWPH